MKFPSSPHSTLQELNHAVILSAAKDRTWFLKIRGEILRCPQNDNRGTFFRIDMLRYLKAAFFAGVDVPALGHVPINILCVSAFAVFGFVEPAFWLLGMALETVFLFALASNGRFQKVVDAQALQLSEGDAEAKRQALVRELPADSQKRLATLTRQCTKVLDVYRNLQAEDFVIGTNQEALRRLEWLYLKLLVGRFHLAANAEGTDQDLTKKIADLEADLKAGEETEALLQSKTATLNILKKRLANLSRREQTLQEIDSDLTRIENQVDLILENATIQGKPQTISTDIELASDLVGGAAFGDSEVAIADLDQAFGQAAGPAQARVRDHASKLKQ